MIAIQDYEEIVAALGRASNAEVAQVVHSYRGYRRNADGTTSEITIELLRGSTGFTVEAWTGDGRSARPGQPTWDLETAIAATDWPGLGPANA